MKSFAVWCTYKNEQTDTAKLDIHVNCWKLNKKRSIKKPLKKEEFFIDFGFLIDSKKDIETIKFYLPFRAQRTNIFDLGHVFKEKPNLILNVFNDDFNINIGEISKEIIVSNKEKQFSIYSLDLDNGDCNLEQKYDGTILNIKVSNLNISEDKVYFRFRICSKELMSILKKHKTVSSFVESTLTYTEVIDFRLNEKRLYHNSLSEAIKASGELKIPKLHFLFITNFDEDVTISGTNPTSRKLEKVWSDYVGHIYDISNVFTYHVKQNNVSNNGFNSLIKLKIQKSTIVKFFTYFSFLAITAIFFNFISSILDHFGLVELFLNLFITNEGS